jgi:hypothetical protein
LASAEGGLLFAPLYANRARVDDRVERRGRTVAELELVSKYLDVSFATREVLIALNMRRKL